MTSCKLCLLNLIFLLDLVPRMNKHIWTKKPIRVKVMFACFLNFSLALICRAEKSKKKIVVNNVRKKKEQFDLIKFFNVVRDTFNTRK